MFALRTKTARTFKANFNNLYGGKIECPLKCWDLNLHEPPPKDDQEHILWCKKVKTNNPIVAKGNVQYSDLFADVHEQKEVLSMYEMLI